MKNKTLYFIYNKNNLILIANLQDKENYLKQVSGDDFKTNKNSIRNINVVKKQFSTKLYDFLLDEEAIIQNHIQAIQNLKQN